MGELRLRKRNNKWEYSFEGAKVEGKRKYVSKTGFRTKAEAATAGAKAMDEYNRAGVVFAPKDISFSDYLDIWMEQYCKKNCKIDTVSNYEKKIRLHIKPALGHYKLTAISPLALQKFIDGMFSKGYSRNTLAVVKGIITGCLSYAVQPLGFLQNSPAVYIKLPSKRAETGVSSRSCPHTYIPPEQMEKILKRFPEGSSSYIPLVIGYKCGLRIGEAFALTWDCIDLSENKLTINKQIQWHDRDRVNDQKGYWYFSSPKYDSFRTIELSSDVAEILNREKLRQKQAAALYSDLYVTYYEDENRRLNTDGVGKEVDLVMRRINGEYIISRNMQHVSFVAREELGFSKFDYHSLRHTHATMLAERGASPKFIQQRLGHKNVQVTMQVYEHLTQTMIDEGASIVESFALPTEL